MIDKKIFTRIRFYLSRVFLVSKENQEKREHQVSQETLDGQGKTGKTVAEDPKETQAKPVLLDLLGKEEEKVQ